MLFSVSLLCEKCDRIHASLIEKPHGEDLKLEYPCEACGLPAKRLLNSNFSKAEIEEKTHGGIRTKEGLLRKYTGWKETARQESLDNDIQLAYQRQDWNGAKEMKKELTKLTDEAKKKL